jgi:hypothetical protein
LAAHFSYEHAAGIRRLVGGLQIALSLPVWLAAVRADWIHSDLRRFFLAIWVVCFGTFLWAIFVEWRWHRRCVELADATLKAPQLDPATGCAGGHREAV